MRLRTSWNDIGSICLIECPASLRLALVVTAILVAHLLGLLWVFAADYAREGVRADVQAELTDLRNHVRHLWGGHQALRTRLDLAELAQEPRWAWKTGQDMGQMPTEAEEPFERLCGHNAAEGG